MEKNLNYDQSCNLMLAYRTLQHLTQLAKANGYEPTCLIDDDNDGQLYFNLRHTVGEMGGPCFLRDIDTEEASIFAQKAEVFRAYWEKFIGDKRNADAKRISELKEELAKLEGRA